MEKSHEFFMREALAEAQKAAEITGWRPAVGSVIVKNKKIIARGHTQKNGREHAEANALKKAGKRAKDATLYSTLEPCCHNSQAESCCQKIANAKIKKAVFGAADAATKNKNKARGFLARRKIRVVPNFLREACEEWHEVYLTNIRENRPYAIVSIAQSLDGKIAWKKGASRTPISGTDTMRRVHFMRSRVDAICVGANTLELDDPRLTARRAKAKNPDRIIVDSTGKIRPTANVFADKSARVFVLTTPRMSAKKERQLANHGAIVVCTKALPGGRVDLRKAFSALWTQFRIRHVMIEGGGELIGSALKARLVDRTVFWISPRLIGGRTTPTSVDGEGLRAFRHAAELFIENVERVGNDLMITGKVNYGDNRP